MYCWQLFLILIIANLTGPSLTLAQDDAARWSPRLLPELGTVRWHRDFDASQLLSRQTGKPMFVLFQEVPGCAGCQRFGKEVLSNALLVEAIETEFVPVLVYNNRESGEDKALLTRFQEPAWNYQVVRFLNGDAEDLIPRRDRIWTTPAMADRMIKARDKAQRPVPKYLQSLRATSMPPAKLGSAAFAMSCFWTGEYELGNIDGVVATEAGWLDDREVTLVRFDPQRVSLGSLAKQAAKVRCAEKIYTEDPQAIGRSAAGKLDGSYRIAAPSDQKRQLAQWPELAGVPDLNAMQLTKLNALAPRDRNAALEWLSPNQRKDLLGDE